jgi:hypothetical protein
MVLTLNPSIIVLLPLKEIDHGAYFSLCLLKSTNKNENTPISVLRSKNLE